MHIPSPPPGSRTRPCGFEDRRAPDTLAGIKDRCPCQESNLVFNLRRVACDSVTLKGPRSISAGAQGFEPCPRVLEARCSPRSTPLSASVARRARLSRQAMLPEPVLCFKKLDQLSTGTIATE